MAKAGGSKWTLFRTVLYIPKVCTVSIQTTVCQRKFRLERSMMLLINSVLIALVTAFLVGSPNGESIYASVLMPASTKRNFEITSNRPGRIIPWRPILYHGYGSSGCEKMVVIEGSVKQKSFRRMQLMRPVTVTLARAKTFEYSSAERGITNLTQSNR